MGTALMAPRKKIKRNPAAEAVAKAIIENYQPETVADMQDAIRDIFGPMFESMLQGEMDNHLGYESNDHGALSISSGTQSNMCRQRTTRSSRHS